MFWEYCNPLEYRNLYQYFRFQKSNGVFYSEIYPSASLGVKWLAQRTHVRFRCHFTFALLRKKFLGEISGFTFIPIIQYFFKLSSIILKFRKNG